MQLKLQPHASDMIGWYLGSLPLSINCIEGKMRVWLVLLLTEVVNVSVLLLGCRHPSSFLVLSWL